MSFHVSSDKTKFGCSLREICLDVNDHIESLYEQATLKLKAG